MLEIAEFSIVGDHNRMIARGKEMLRFSMNQLRDGYDRLRKPQPLHFSLQQVSPRARCGRNDDMFTRSGCIRFVCLFRLSNDERKFKEKTAARSNRTIQILGCGDSNLTAHLPNQVATDR